MLHHVRLYQDKFDELVQSRKTMLFINSKEPIEQDHEVVFNEVLYTFTLRKKRVVKAKVLYSAERPRRNLTPSYFVILQVERD